MSKQYLAPDVARYRAAVEHAQLGLLVGRPVEPAKGFAQESVETEGTPEVVAVVGLRAGVEPATS